ncbi:hypothetical protein B0A55_11946 [Friedmanniomyces simplex]|uniref:Uncharacterized protein n=1 Tax=Friedmanniomyces simplex TaxID=329884 RepID=A0A4V5NG08_9PEZI|nr:hypothetical protein B0A55_11946 [Friedmanniomyces simplex]
MLSRITVGIFQLMTHQDCPTILLCFQPAKIGKWRLSDIEVYEEMFGHESGMNFDQCYNRFIGDIKVV